MNSEEMLKSGNRSGTTRLSGGLKLKSDIHNIQPVKLK